MILGSCTGEVSPVSVWLESGPAAGAPATSILRLAVAVSDVESVTCTVKSEVSAAEGVPPTVPPAASERPAGSEPEETFRLIAGGAATTGRETCGIWSARGRTGKRRRRDRKCGRGREIRAGAAAAAASLEQAAGQENREKSPWSSGAPGPTGRCADHATRAGESSMSRPISRQQREGGGKTRAGSFH